VIKFYQILPLLIMLESFLAAVPLAIAGRWGPAVYWFAAGLLNFSVIFMMERTG